jgi:hypothetical protein
MNLKEIDEENKRLEKEFPILFSQKHNSPFGTPENYFNEVEKNIFSNTKLLSFKKEVFTVPDKYFEENDLNIKNSLLSDQEKPSPFSVDESYFIQSTEQLETILQLEAFKNQSVFTIPQNYFESNEDLIKSALEKDNVRKLNNSFRWTNFFAAAACLASVCLMTVYFLTGSSNEKLQLSKLQIEQIKERPSDFGLDESLLADLYDNYSVDQTKEKILNDSLINQMVEDPSLDLNTLIEIE